MRSVILLICAYCILAGNLFAQTSSDSLLHVIYSKKPYADRIAAVLFYEEKLGPQHPNKMLALAQYGLELAIQNDDPISVAELNRYAGEALFLKNEFSAAATFYQQAISLLENTKEKRKLGLAYSAMAALLRKTKDLPRSKDLYEKADQIYQATNNRSGRAQVQNELGTIYEYQGNYKRATGLYNSALNIYRMLKDSAGIAWSLSNLAGIHHLQKSFPSEHSLLQEVLFIRKKLGNQFSLALVYSDLAANAVASKKLDAARNFYDSSDGIAERFNYRPLKQTNRILLAEINRQQGSYEATQGYFTARSAIRDSLFGMERRGQTDDLGNRHETVKKEQKVLEQQHRLSIQKIIIVAGAIILLLVLLLAYAQLRRMKWKQEALLQSAIMRQQQLAAKAVMKTEEAERQRIARDLHDSIGQMMSAAKMNLSAFEHKTKFESDSQRKSFSKAMNLVDESCKEIRSVSHHMMPRALSHQNLDAALRDFISKLDQQHLSVQVYTSGLTERLNSDTETILYRVIQECVNNVVKHSGATSMDISVIKEKSEINALIQDNGKGFNKNDSDNTQGIGLKNIRTRIRYLKGTVDFDTAPGRGTVVSIFVPVD